MSSLKGVSHSNGRIYPETQMDATKQQSVKTHNHFFSRLKRLFGSGTFKVGIGEKTHRVSNKSAFKLIKMTSPEKSGLTYKEFKNWDTTKKIAELQTCFKILKKTKPADSDTKKNRRESTSIKEEETKPGNNPFQNPVPVVDPLPKGQDQERLKDDLDKESSSSESSKEESKSDNDLLPKGQDQERLKDDLDKESSSSESFKEKTKLEDLSQSKQKNEKETGSYKEFLDQKNLTDLVPETIHAIDFTGISAAEFEQMFGKDSVSFASNYVLNNLLTKQLSSICVYFKKDHFDAICGVEEEGVIPEEKKITLQTFSVDDLNILYPYFEYEHWCLLSEQINKMDLSAMTKEQFNKMCKSLGLGALSLYPTAKKILNSLRIDQLNRLYPHFEASHLRQLSINGLNTLYPHFKKEDWEKLSMDEQIPEMDLSGMTKEQFDKMCSKHYLGASLLDRATNILQGLQINQVNSLYPFFESMHWAALSMDEQIPEMDLSAMTKEQFDKMCSKDYTGVSLLSRATNILQRLQINQVNSLYPIFEPMHWVALSLNQQISEMDLSAMTKEQFDKMCSKHYLGTSLLGRATNILQGLQINQVNSLYPFFESMHWAALSLNQQISEMDLSAMTKEQFDKMCSKHYSGASLLDRATNILQGLQINQVNSLYPFFESMHWAALSLNQQISEMDLSAMTKEQFDKMCSKHYLGTSLLDRATNILQGLQINQVNSLYPFFESMHWAALSMDEQIPEMDLSAMTKEQFDKMCSKHYSGTSLLGRAANILQRLQINQANSLYPFFESMHWGKLSMDEQIPEMDLSAMTKEQFNEMCSRDISGALTERSQTTLRALQPRQLNSVYPHFDLTHWEQISPRKIQSMDFSKMTKAQFNEMCWSLSGDNEKRLSVNGSRILNNLLQNQLNDLYPHFETIHFKVILSEVGKLEGLDFGIMTEAVYNTMLPAEDDKLRKELFSQLTDQQKQILRDKNILTPEKEAAFN